MKRIVLSFIIGAALSTGCASLDHVHAKMDMMEQHLTSASKPVYEGQLQSLQKIGPMTALQFSDGQLFDVAKAPAGLNSGDTVRIYQVDKEYEAHLWHSAKPDVSAEASALAPALSH